MGKVGIVAAGIAAALAVLAPSAEAATGRLTAAVAPEGYARLVFSFDDLPKPEARLANGVLVVSFAEPVTLEMDGAMAALGGLVGVARRDPDGTALRIALQRPVKLNVVEAGETFFVDLLPSNWAGLPPPLPRDVVERLTREAREARALKADEERLKARPRQPLVVRGATHPTFRRLVFEVDPAVAVDFKRVGGRASVTFSPAPPFDLGVARAGLPPEFGKLDASKSGDVLTVSGPAPEDHDVRGFREDGAFILDIDRDDAAEASASSHGHGGAEAAPADAPTAARKDAEPQPRGETKPQAAGSAGSSPPASPSPAGPAPAAHSAPVEAGPPVASRDGETLRLTFPFERAVPAAIFLRGRTLWVVFDDPAPLALDPLVAASGGRIVAAGASAVDGGLALRFTLDEPRLVTAAADGGAWTIAIGEGVLPRSGAIELEPAFGRDGKAAIRAEMPGLGAARIIADPEVGDRIAVATARGPARGLVAPRQFVEFAALASAHGLALVPFADDFRIAAGLEAVTVDRPAGLTVSSVAPPSESAQPESGGAEATLSAVAWAEENAEPLAKRENALLAAAAFAEPERRTEERLALARFYLLRGRPADAKGVLDAVAEDDAGAERDGRFPILRAAADVLLGRPRAALTVLSDPALASSPEAALWRGEAEAALGRPGAARAALSRGEPALGGLAPPIKARFLERALDLALAGSDPAAAASVFARLEPLPSPRGFGAREILRARVAEVSGRADRAAAIYRSVTAGGDPVAAAEAELRSIELGLSTGALKADDAIPALERLVTGWRGDWIEASALSRLIGLYGDAGRWREAFGTLRIAVSAFPDADDTRALQDRMQERFTDLFLGAGLDKMPKLDALALFYDFKELAPGGKRGDELVRRLADKLVEFDLLDQASALLSYQVDNRLTGAARAQVAAQAAVVHLMNGKPAEAVAILRRTRQADLPASLTRRRMALEARALADTGRIDLALEMAEGMEGPEGRKLAADVLWAARRWPEAGEAMEAALGSSWRRPDPLTPAERRDVLRAAIALSLAQDSLGVDRLREKFAAKLAHSPDAHAFDVVTAPLEARGPAFRDLARTIATSAAFEGFMAEYRRGAEKDETRQSDARPADTRPGGA